MSLAHHRLCHDVHTGEHLHLVLTLLKQECMFGANAEACCYMVHALNLECAVAVIRLHPDGSLCKQRTVTTAGNLKRAVAVIRLHPDGSLCKQRTVTTAGNLECAVAVIHSHPGGGLCLAPQGCAGAHVHKAAGHGAGPPDRVCEAGECGLL